MPDTHETPAIKKRLLTLLTYTLLSFALSFTITYSLSQSFNLVFQAPNVLLLNLYVVAAVSVIFLNKYTLRVFLALLALAALLIAIIAIAGPILKPENFLHITNLKLGETLTAVYDDILNFIAWTSTYVEGQAVVSLRYQLYLLIGFNLCAVFICYTFTVKLYNFYIILLAGLSLFTAQWLTGYMHSIYPFALYIFLLLACCLIQANKTFFTKYGGSSLPVYSFAIFILPICIVATAISFLITAPNKPVAWNFVTINATRAVNFFNEYFYLRGLDAATVFTAESDIVRLGGDMPQSNTEIMTVQTPVPLYLRFNSFDTYDGTTWQRLFIRDSELPYNEDKKGFVIPNNFDKLLLSELTGYRMLQPLPEYFTPHQARITFGNHRSRALYTTFNAEMLAYDSEKEFVVYNESDVLISNKTHGKDFSYILTFSTLDRNEPEVDTRLNYAERGIYNQVLRYYDEFYSRAYDYHDLAGIINRIDTINSTYTQLPDTLPIRVRELAGKITQFSYTDYQRAAAIEEYLSTNFTYTKEPPPLPEGADFVDHFLFEGKTGYCTYYASAMTVLSRCVGLPTRYVSGYIAEPATSGEPVTLTYEQAHAWAEVYLEGIGWVNFEPTSPYNANRQQAAQANYSSSGYSYYEDYMNQMQLYNTGEMAPYDGAAETAPDTRFDWFFNNLKLYLPLLSIAALLLLLLLLCLLNIIIRRLRLFRLKRLQPRPSIIAAYIYYTKLLRLYGIKPDKGETPRQFAARADKYLLLSPITFAEATTLFENARYSEVADVKANDRVTEADKQNMIAIYPDLLRETKNMIGTVKYVLFAYLLNRI